MSEKDYNSKKITNLIKDRIILSQYIFSFTKLEKKGDHFLGICPFHNEKTPSFTVNDEKKFFHCFGCSAHGDIFEFVMRSRNIQFLDALNYLAEILNLKIEKIKPDNKLKKIYDALELAKEFFHNKLLNKNFESIKAIEYLKEREIDFELIKNFKLGLAPENDSELFNSLLKSGIELETMIEAGLIRKKNDSKKSNPKCIFFKRIIFPICDEFGRVIAFGGRVMDKNSLPKYLNSPETILFKKGETLYNIDKVFGNHQKNKNQEIINHEITKKFFTEEENIYVTEGYFDLITMIKHGFKNSVASLGTSITENQVELMWKNFDSPVLCLDGDNAGMIASARIVNKILPILKEGKTLKIANLPDGFDPDNFLKKFGKEKMAEIFNNAKSIHEFIFFNLLNNYSKKIEIPEFKIKFKKDLFEIAKKIKNNEISKAYKEKFSQLCFDFFDKSKFKKNIEKLKKNDLKKFEISNEEEKNLKAEALLVAGILIRPKILNLVENEFSEINFSNEKLSEIKNKIFEHFYGDNYSNFFDFTNFFNEILENDKFSSIKIHVNFFLNKDMSDEDYKNAWIEIFENTIKKRIVNNNLLMVKKNLKINFDEIFWNELKILKDTNFNDK